MKKGILASLMLLLLQAYSLAETTGEGPGAPIDTNEIILIIAAVLLTVGVIAYKKLSLKKA